MFDLLLSFMSPGIIRPEYAAAIAAHAAPSALTSLTLAKAKQPMKDTKVHNAINFRISIFEKLQAKRRSCGVFSMSFLLAGAASVGG